MLESLVKAFMSLPGVGEKSAYRFAYHLVQHNKNAGVILAKALDDTIKNLTNCKHCQTLSTSDICTICGNNKRDNTKICVVKSPLDIVSIEKTASYNGKYFVLGNYISPIDNISPDDINLELLKKITIANGVTEIILATSAATEAEITNNYIIHLFEKTDVKVTKLVRGIPLGGDLEYTDINTLTKALNDRY